MSTREGKESGKGLSQGQSKSKIDMLVKNHDRLPGGR
jgi:hypothetical protein